jgi:CRP-like cAMP-binding protein
MNVANSERVETPQAIVKEALAPFETIEVWPAGQQLFGEGETSAGVYLVHSGEIDLCFASPRSGEAKSLFSAGPGEVLGLSCIVSNRPHDCSATTRTPAITGFVQTNQFLRLLDEKPSLWLSVLRSISTNINACWDCMRGMR